MLNDNRTKSYWFKMLAVVHTEHHCMQCAWCHCLPFVSENKTSGIHRMNPWWYQKLQNLFPALMTFLNAQHVQYFYHKVRYLTLRCNVRRTSNVQTLKSQMFYMGVEDDRIEWLLCRYFLGGRVRALLSGGAPLSADTQSLCRYLLRMYRISGRIIRPDIRLPCWIIW
jgi:hypothetical protein